MKNLRTHINGLDLASVLNFKGGNSAPAHKAVTPVYYVDKCNVLGGYVIVDYTLNDEWSDTIISLIDLTAFADTEGLNDYCYDRSINGEHVQDAGTIDMDTFMSENLDEAVEAYLTAKRIGQNVN